MTALGVEATLDRDGPPGPAWTQEIVEREREFRRGRWQQIRDAHRSDPGRQEELTVLTEQQCRSSVDALAVLDRLIADQDLDSFKTDLQEWAGHAPRGHSAFNGVNGQMFVNQVVNAVDRGPADLAQLLADALSAPADVDDARRKLDALVAWVEAVKQGAHPAPARVPFVCSFFWSLREPDRWPCLWTSAEATLRNLGWLLATDDQAHRYLAFRDQVLALGDPPTEVADALWWFDQDPSRVGLDPSLIERCRLLAQVRDRVYSDTLTSDELRDRVRQSTAIDGTNLLDAARDMADGVRNELAVYSRSLADQVAAALGRSVKGKVSAPTGRAKDGLRSDAWFEWEVADQGVPGCGVILWVTPDGVHVLSGGTRTLSAADVPTAVRALLPLTPEGLRTFRADYPNVHPVEPGELDGYHGSFGIGARFPDDEALGNPEFRGTIERVTADLQPVIDRFISTFGGPASPRQQPADDPLRSLVAEFIDQRGYPTAKDQAHRDDRKAMAALLAPDEVFYIDLSQLRSIYNSHRYGAPGPQSVLNVTLRDAGPHELDGILRKLHTLVWGDGEDAYRIDRLLSPDHAVRGLGESVIMKLLAICHPDRYIPVFPLTGEMGKAQLMRLLDLEPPDESLTRGQRQVMANDAIRSRLDPFFPNDPFGQAQFLYWLRTRDEAETAAEADLSAAAGELHLDVAHLEEWVDLLRDKGQIVLYGPPGTGKTYVARKLAEALAPDQSRRAVVQFHPSTTYEDFFEGYRPDGIDGQVNYRLTPGPLAIMAERAGRAPGLDHILVIDELNRANLPKVFGELLYLLEYRDEQVRTLYRPDDPFELPTNLLVIATMNTADRSVGLVDAALRRRFHFVPFFPNEGPTAGVLRRWLHNEGLPPWPAELVELVNADLSRDLGGPDLQIGHSHFMGPKLDMARMRRIWTYSIHPTIADQLYGNQEKVDHYRFDHVMDRYRNQLAGADLPQAGDDDLAGGAAVTEG